MSCRGNKIWFLFDSRLIKLKDRFRLTKGSFSISSLIYHIRADKRMLVSWNELNKITWDQKPLIFSWVQPGCHCRWYWCQRTVKGTDCYCGGLTDLHHCAGAQQRPPWSGHLMEDSRQSSSIHVYVFLHRKVGVNSGRSDQLALAESGLLTFDPRWAVLSINPLGLSWSWCSILSSGSAKHTATFTLQLPFSVSLSRSSIFPVCQLASCTDLSNPPRSTSITVAAK